MWEDISNRGKSIPYFRPSKSVTVNTEIYIKECLQPRLLPFIYKHHRNISFQFLHDLAGAHFSTETIANMKENFPFFDNTTIHPNVKDQKRTYGVNWQRKFMREDGRAQRSRS
jgi:hypothetical protein